MILPGLVTCEEGEEEASEQSQLLPTSYSQALSPQEIPRKDETHPALRAQQQGEHLLHGAWSWEALVTGR